MTKDEIIRMAKECGLPLTYVPHELFLTNTYPREFSRMKCRACDYERKATPEEIAIGNKHEHR